jgi:hypothetical protein
MHHLQHPVVEGGRSGDDATLAEGQELFQKVTPRVEIREDDVAGLVARIDLIRRARPVRRRWLVAVDCHHDRDNGVGHDRAQLRPRAAVDRAARQVE